MHMIRHNAEREEFVAHVREAGAGGDLGHGTSKKGGNLGGDAIGEAGPAASTKSYARNLPPYKGSQGRSGPPDVRPRRRIPLT